MAFILTAFVSGVLLVGAVCQTVELTAALMPLPVVGMTRLINHNGTREYQQRIFPRFDINSQTILS